MNIKISTLLICACTTILFLGACSKKICEMCNGTGYTEESDFCPDCERRGKIAYTCNDCKGNGKRHMVFKCSTCGGSGVIEKSCTKCNGTGIINVKVQCSCGIARNSAKTFFIGLSIFAFLLSFPFGGEDDTILFNILFWLIILGYGLFYTISVIWRWARGNHPQEG